VGGSSWKGPKHWLLLALLALILAGVFIFLLDYAVGNPKRTPDFVILYTAGTILRQQPANDLYDITLQRKIQRQLNPHGQFLPFDHAPFEALFFEPLSYLSLTPAFMVWSVLNLALLGGVFCLLPYTGYRLRGESLFAWGAVWFLPVAEAIAVGQDSIFLAMVFLLAFLALKKKRDFAAGLALGAGFYRFEIVLPFVFILLLKKRGKALSGFFSACVASLLVSLAVVGWNGLRNYAGVLLAVGRTEGSHANGVFLSMMPSLRAALVTFADSKVPPHVLFLAVLAASVLLLGWAAWQFTSVSRPEENAFDLQFSLAVIAALLASYHIYAHELTPLIPVAFVVLGYERKASRAGSLSVAKSATLLLLCLLMLPGGGLTVHGVSLLFFVLLGLCVWLSVEIRSLRRYGAAHVCPGREGAPSLP
jgi:hypothetical protein